MSPDECHNRNCQNNKTVTGCIESEKSWAAGIEKAQKEVAEGKVLPFESVMYELLEEYK